MIYMELRWLNKQLFGGSARWCWGSMTHFSAAVTLINWALGCFMGSSVPAL